MRGSHRAIPKLHLNFMYAYKNVPTDRLKFSSARALSFQKMKIFRVWFNSFLYNLHFSLVLHSCWKKLTQTSHHPWNKDIDFTSREFMQVTLKCLPGSTFTPKASVLIHILLWCVFGKNRKYFANTPSIRMCLDSEFLSTFALNNCKKPTKILVIYQTFSLMFYL